MQLMVTFEACPVPGIAASAAHYKVLSLCEVGKEKAVRRPGSQEASVLAADLLYDLQGSSLGLSFPQQLR